MTNNDEEANEELLEHLKIIDAGINVEPRPTLMARLANAWKPLKVKAALAHIGLMVSLAVYCVVGGIVSTSIYLHFVYQLFETIRYVSLVAGCLREREPPSVRREDIACLAHMVWLLGPSCLRTIPLHFGKRPLESKRRYFFFFLSRTCRKECRRQPVCVAFMHETKRKDQKRRKKQVKFKQTNDEGETIQCENKETANTSESARANESSDPVKFQFNCCCAIAHDHFQEVNHISAAAAVAAATVATKFHRIYLSQTTLH